jgi:hypothetical protein
MTPEYKNKFAISQSAIKDWENMSPLRWRSTWIDKTRKRPDVGASAGFGSLLDCLSYTPDRFDKQFVEAEIELPTESIQKVVTNVYNSLIELNTNAEELNKNLKKKQKPVPIKELKLDYLDLITKASKEAEYYVKQPARAYTETLKGGQDYFELLKKLKGRKAVSKEDMEMAKKLKEILYNDKHVKGFFVPNKDCELIFQQQIFTNIDVTGFENLDFLPLKGMLDSILLNDKKKTARECDLKWTEDAFLFKEVVKRFGYIKQHSFYDYLLREWLKTYKDGEYKDYTVGNPVNVVIDSDEKVPYIYQYNANDLHIERYGHENMYWFKGWEQTLYEIGWHMDTQQWDRPREHYLNNCMNIQQFRR